MIPAWLTLAALRGAVSRGLKWLGGLNGYELLALAFAALLVVDHIALVMAHRHSAKVEKQLTKCSSARIADQQAYAKAQADAAAKNAAQVKRTEQQQKDVSDETVALLNADIARLRRELSTGSAAPQSHPGQPGLSQGGQSAGGAAGEARMCLSSAELLRAAENEERHDRLIDWVEKQSAIDPNGTLP